jgi:N-acetylglucosaminyldiphosphoundecaprenol N-acetyl-beta-D-mannosaminyltransferase
MDSCDIFSHLMMAMDKPQQTMILGARLDLIGLGALLDRLMRDASDATRSEPYWVANHNLHGLYWFQRSQSYREFSKYADLVVVDGMSLVWAGRLLGRPIRATHRHTHLDYCPALFSRLSGSKCSIFLLGGTPESNGGALGELRSRYPGIRFEGHHGYFDKLADADAILARINDLSPSILLVGFGMPLQEEWLVQMRGRLRARVIIPTGGLIDYFSAVSSSPPRWLGRLGFEWLYRFMTNPRRLFVRYFIEPWALIPALAKDLIVTLLRGPPSE